MIIDIEEFLIPKYHYHDIINIIEIVKVCHSKMLNFFISAMHMLMISVFAVLLMPFYLISINMVTIIVDKIFNIARPSLIERM